MTSGRTVFECAIEEALVEHPSSRCPWWPAFDDITHGFRDHEFSIFCGQPGIGKTQWLACLSVQLAEQRIRQFVMSVETGPEDYVRRMASAVASQDINTGDAISGELAMEITKNHGSMFYRDDMLFSLYDNRVSLDQLESDMTKASDVGAKIIIIDNLSFFMEPTRSQDANLEMDRVTHRIVMLSKRLPIHTIMVMHPRKPGIDGKLRVRNMYDIRGSSIAVNEAQNIFLFNTVNMDDFDERFLREMSVEHTSRTLKVEKMRRRGSAVGTEIHFKFLGGRYKEAGRWIK